MGPPIATKRENNVGQLKRDAIAVRVGRYREILAVNPAIAKIAGKAKSPVDTNKSYAVGEFKRCSVAVIISVHKIAVRLRLDIAE